MKRNQSRKFGDKTYHLETIFTMKTKAKERAEHLRKKGQKARVTKSGQRHFVWWHP
jgi:hypothetical protein